LSDLVVIDDLNFLDGSDLRAVFQQVTEPQILAALSGVTPLLRKQLLEKLPVATARRLETLVNDQGLATPEAVASAERALIDALYRLSRGGQVAFDVPEDMVA
jgi:hypothetical protein